MFTMMVCYRFTKKYILQYIVPLDRYKFTHNFSKTVNNEHNSHTRLQNGMLRD